MLPILALAAVLNADSVNVNAIYALEDLDSVLIERQVVVADTPTILIQTCDVSADTLKTALHFARLVWRGQYNAARNIPGFEHAILARDKSESTRDRRYALLCHDDGNLPEVIVEVTKELHVLVLTYITNKGMIIAVAQPVPMAIPKEQ